MKTLENYEQLAAELLKVLGYDAMAAEVLSGEQTALRSFQWLRNIKAFNLFSEQQKLIIDAALVALLKMGK